MSLREGVLKVADDLADYVSNFDSASEDVIRGWEMALRAVVAAAQPWDVKEFAREVAAYVEAQRSKEPVRVVVEGVATTNLPLPIHVNPMEDSLAEAHRRIGVVVEAVAALEKDMKANNPRNRILGPGKPAYESPPGAGDSEVLRELVEATKNKLAKEVRT